MDKTLLGRLGRVLKQNGSMALITMMFFAGSAVVWSFGVPLEQVMANYSYGVLVILIVMDLFTGLIVETGIMQRLAVKIAGWSKGKRRSCLVMFGSMMFVISAGLNNITAVMMILPVIFVLLKALEVDERFICTFFATILALSNTGGAASPIGDFPAIVIMKSGITNFIGYLLRALPLFALTSVALLIVWGLRVKKESGNDASRNLAILILKSQYKNQTVRFDALMWLGVVFAGMFLAWSFVSQKLLPPETVAVLGYTAALLICAMKGMKINMAMDMKSVLTIASFLFFAETISQTGLLKIMAVYLQAHIDNPRYLVAIIMIITSIVAGIFSAGPAAAAMMPVIVEICRGPLQAWSDWIAVAYAAAICAGSSLFMWSATAGFILSGKVNEAGLDDENGRKIRWGVVSYLGYGFVNYAIQMSIALLVIMALL